LTLIKSISGIRGTLGGNPGKNLTAIDIVECAAGFGEWLKKQNKPERIVIGRDGRVSGNWVNTLVTNTLLSQGIDVVDLGLSTTPTVEMLVPKLNAGAGIIITASHNPQEWNALKFLNYKGEFISADDGQSILDNIDEGLINFSEYKEFGTYTQITDAFEHHITEILDLEYVPENQIKKAKFKVVVDCINSTGAISIPPLLQALGVEYMLINEEINGVFAHNPEPLPKNLTKLAEAVVNFNADFGIAVDPDVDRLALVCEDGSFFGEEYTLVAVADYLLNHKKGSTVSNLSSSRALSDITKNYGCDYFAASVGEVNVVKEMKLRNAVIGGEGNGGIIYPGLHYGRDALVGIAFVLALLSERKMSLGEIRKSYPNYIIIKDKIPLSEDLNLETIFKLLTDKFSSEKLNHSDGLKIDFQQGWVHMRKSNTEPIVRIYAEAKTREEAEDIIKKISTEIPV
jgi:phosphomannomutase